VSAASRSAARAPAGTGVTGGRCVQVVPLGGRAQVDHGQFAQARAGLVRAEGDGGGAFVMTA
jgi:hypothetical protein